MAITSEESFSATDVAFFRVAPPRASRFRAHIRCSISYIQHDRSFVVPFIILFTIHGLNERESREGGARVGSSEVGSLIESHPEGAAIRLLHNWRVGALKVQIWLMTLSPWGMPVCVVNACH